MSYGRKRRIGCVGVKVPTMTCDFLSEREREEFPVMDAQHTSTLGLTSKASSKIKTIMITKDRKAMCCECEKKSRK